MEIAVIGINHDTAPTEIREGVAFTDSKKIEAINYILDKGIEETIILSTCNRSEIYIVDRERDINESIDIIKEFYAEFSGSRNIDKYIFILKGKEALYHLYHVSSGLKSIVLGEDQILGQVKEAHVFSMDLGASKKVLNKVFREAITTAKNIKSQLKISEHPLSVSYIGVKLLVEKLGGLKGKKALVMGIGEMGKLALKNLIDENLGKIYMTNRSHDKVIDVAKDYPQVIPIDYKRRYEIIKDIDILITATACPHTIVKLEDMPKLDRRLYIMDLALPRDVDEEIGRLDKVSLYNIDSLKEISSENEKKRQELSRKAEKIIKGEIEELLRHLRVVKVDPIIKAINEERGRIEEDTLDYIYRKLDLGTKEKKIIEKMLSSALKRVMRKPIIKLKELEDEEKIDSYIDMINELFDFKGE